MDTLAVFSHLVCSRFPIFPYASISADALLVVLTTKKKPSVFV